jgi:hypothetical protein
MADKAAEETRKLSERERDPDQAAPPGAIWVCGACGKQAKNRFNGGISQHWDESCMLNAVLCDEKSLVYQGALVIKADAIPEKTNG